jgi:hypothetical protein
MRLLSKTGSLTVLVAASLVVGIVLWPRPSPGRPRPESVPSVEQPSAAIAADQATPAAVQRDQPGCTITILGSDGGPLAAAHASWLAKDDPAHTLGPPSGDAGVRADSEGRVRLTPKARGSEVLLVRASEHVPTIVAPVVDGATVRLAGAAWVDVSVVDADGHPVAGACTTLTHRPLGDFTSLTPFGIGHPFSSHPRWRAGTDGRGVARIDELPPGTFYLTVLAPGLVPTGEAGVNSVVDLRAGANRLHVTLEDAFGVVFQCPSRAAVASVTWNVDVRRFDRSARAVASLGMLRDGLLARFPQGIPYVQVLNPRQRDPVSVQCTVRLEDGTLWKGAWDLQPVRAIDSPVFLELEEGAVRPVTIRLVTPNGRQFDGLPVVLRAPDGGASIRTKTGEQAFVPHGTYKVNALQADPPIYAAFEGFVVTVDESSADVFVATMPEAVSQLVVRVRYPSPTALGVISLALFNERGEGSKVVNYRPDRGEIRSFVTGETVAIQVTSVFYEDIIIEPKKLDPDHPTVVEVVLAEKKAAPR